MSHRLAKSSSIFSLKGSVSQACLGNPLTDKLGKAWYPRIDFFFICMKLIALHFLAYKEISLIYENLSTIFSTYLHIHTGLTRRKASVHTLMRQSLRVTISKF